MSDNKYINKINKEKDKCNKLINKLYGDSFYFMHITRLSNLKSILKNGILKISSNVNNINYGDSLYENDKKPPYLYCQIVFDDMKELNKDRDYSSIYSLLLHPKILFDNNAIFNKQWEGFPIKKNQATKHIMESININKNDNYENKIKNIKKIKNIIKEKLIENKLHEEKHEFIFTKDIKIKNYLIGILYNKHYKEDIQIVNNILKKYGYNNIPIYYDIKEIPTLCNILIDN
jgi:hypothetical protein